MKDKSRRLGEKRLAEVSCTETFMSAARDYAQRATSALGEKIDSIVLYGSVATGHARPDSDIDVLVIAPDSKSIYEALSSISAEQAYETRSAFLLSDVFLDRYEFVELQKVRSPFIKNVMADGIVLYDNGTFQGIRGQPADCC